VSLFPLGMRVPRNEQRVFAPIPRGHGSLRAIDERGRPLSEGHEIGPAGGTLHGDMSFTTAVDIRSWIAPRLGADPGRRERVVRGELTFTSGVALALAPGGDSVTTLRTPIEVPLIGPGTTLQARERRLERSGATQAWVFAGFVDEWGHPLSDQRLLG